MKRWVARPIRGLSIYDERKTKARYNSEATSYGSVSSVQRRKGPEDGYASDEIYSLHILGSIIDRSIVNHSISIVCYA